MPEKRFIEILFDWSFSEFVTIRIIKFLYILGIVAAGIGALFVFAGSASQGFGGFVGGLVIAPIVFCLGVLGARIWLEMLIVMFRIAENTSLLVQQRNSGATDGVARE